MLRAIEMSWFVLDKYYYLDKVSVYIVALLLDLSRRNAYIKQNWPETWYKGAIISTVIF
jgi:hypothetical protein